MKKEQQKINAENLQKWHNNLYRFEDFYLKSKEMTIAEKIRQAKILIEDGIRFNADIFILTKVYQHLSDLEISKEIGESDNIVLLSNYR